MLKQSEVAQKEESLRRIIRDLPDDTRKEFYRIVKKKLKDPDTFAVLNYLFITGLHHFYLGHWLRGIFNFVGFIAALVMVIDGLWAFGLGLFALISLTEIYALFRSQLIVQNHNNQLMEATLQKL